jgi:chromosome segregation ATPase
LQIQEQLRKQSLKLQATASNLTQSEAVNSGLKKQLDEYKTKFQQSEVDNSGLKKQLEAKEEVLKNNNETQTQLQTSIDGLTKILNQAIPRLCETMENVSTYTIAAVALSEWTEISPGICRAKLLIV